MATHKLLPGEQYLIQTVDKRLALTTHRLIQRRAIWSQKAGQAVMLEDIAAWELKLSGNTLYLLLSIAAALLVYFNDSFFLLSGFFIALYLMTHRRKVHVRTTAGDTMVLPLDVEDNSIRSLIDMVKQAQHNRVSTLQFNEPSMAAA
ncbi:hypothetical protein [Pontibacter akesuensis]|uniref:Uncharacterized protein n=1 Tax=Pontibacter akesuensis TaxID=388950 RepID=A0A1I7JLV7_9BACT|nr:hypothetical protein [Pontibacter akesuensis]GHA69015.1 hypothetical protein GCM10007389_22580 [Pontibacter akesuensis]SFU86192.1 hypothetical protein SAMN04487941_3016 [Pontibacter akesuensis]